MSGSRGLFQPAGPHKPLGIQGAVVTGAEITAVVEHCREQMAPRYATEGMVDDGGTTTDRFHRAVQLVVVTQLASVPLLQRKLRISVAEAERLLEPMAARGIVGPQEGRAARDVLVLPGRLDHVEALIARIRTGPP